MSSAPNFELVTELQVCIRRDFPLDAPSILNPLDSAPLLEGEWLEMTADYTLKRNTGAGVNLAVFPVHTERGRYDTQAILKADVLFAGQYEADTLIHGTLVGLNIGDPLMVDDVVFGGTITRRALIKAISGKVVVGCVTKITGTGTSAKLRFLHSANWTLP